MAKNPQISLIAAQAACNAIVDLIDVGTGAAQGTLQIYNGTQPTNADDALGAQVLLSSHDMSNPAFGAAADLNPGARATAAAIADDTSANASGTPTWGRVIDRDGNVIFAGSAGVSDADFILDSATITLGQVVKVNSATFTCLEK